MSHHLRGIRHVVWDWNGTLLDDAWLCIDVMNRMLRQRGLPALTPERYQEVFAFPVRDYYARLGFDFRAEPFEVVGLEFIEGYAARQHSCRLQPEAERVLHALGERGLPLSVLSASQRERLEEQARRLEVRRHFVNMVGLDDHYAGGKLEQGLRWMRELGLAGDEVLLVGDTDHDSQVARAMGARCVLVPSGHQSPERLKQCSVPVLECLSEML